jgi:Phage Mu protein F like protein
VNKFFAGAAGDIAKQITAARSRLGKADVDPADVEAILDSIDFGEWEALRAKLEPILIKIAQDGIGVAFDQIGFDAPQDILDQVNEKAVEFARERSADMVGMRFDKDGELVENPRPDMAITESTRDMLRADVAQAIEDGTSTADLADQLEESYAFSATRAETIARFEIAQADVEGNMMAYKDSGVVEGKEWALGSEHDDDDECDDAAELGVVELDDDFGGVGDPPAHPNCVCDVLPVLAGDEQED